MIGRIGLACVALLFAACGNNNNASGLPAGCSAPIVQSTLPAAQVQSLGAKNVGTVVNFTVPPNTASLTLVQQAKSAGLTIVYGSDVIDNSAVPATITDPSGQVWYSDAEPCNDLASPDGGTPAPVSGCQISPDPTQHLGFFGGGSPITAEFTLPNTTKGLNTPLPAGQWQMVVNDYAFECSAGGCADGGTKADSYDISVLTKPAAGANLDVAFYIVGNATTQSGSPLTASNAQSDPKVQRMVATYTNIFANAGITVRNVSFYDVSDADKQRFGTNVSADKNGPCDDLDQMFLLSSQHPGNTVNLFLVQSIRPSANSQGGDVVGVDGAIPGAATLPGTVHSGAAVSLADLFLVRTTDPTACSSAGLNLDCGADLVGYVAAHETGHFLGLFHTTEMPGDYFDPLDDTPKCACTSCASPTDLPKCGNGSSTNGAVLAANQCTVSGACAGGQNLMFWQLDGTVSTGQISGQQGQVMKLSPAIQ